MQISNKVILFNTLTVFKMFTFIAANAQYKIDIKTTKYDEIYASRVAKKTSSFQLKGKVKSLKEFTPNTNDTSYYEFSANGFLTRSQTGGSLISGSYKTITTYLFENDQLKKIKTKIPALGRNEEKVFNANGYLEKEINDWTDYDEKFHQEAFYTYANGCQQLNINYRYKNQSDSWDLTMQDKYTFTFDNKKRLTRVRNISKHNESSYGNTTVISYDSIYNKQNAIFYTDDCAGSNSCLMLNMNIQYDKRGNIIMESLIDGTIRNAMWSYSYSFKSKYNERNEIIEEYILSGNDKKQFHLPDNKPNIYDAEYEKNKTIYQYDYDTRGNWIKKYRIVNNKRKIISQRMIVYFE